LAIAWLGVRLGRIDLPILGRVDAMGRVGGEHEIPAVANPLGVDLGDTLGFPPEVFRPGEEVGLGVGDCGHGLICTVGFILPRGWDGNVEGWESGGGFGWETTKQVARPEVDLTGHRAGRVEPKDQGREPGVRRDRWGPLGGRRHVWSDPLKTTVGIPRDGMLDSGPQIF
jgi:hypothetical protein